ncbi:MAG TPA: hypothetical protein VE197_23165, partial [Mycobacterium sp.]|nr:hypothetical protein [Mycobacterium sp.]
MTISSSLAMGNARVEALQACRRGRQGAVAVRSFADPPGFAERPRDLRAHRTHIALKIPHGDRRDVKPFTGAPPQVINQVMGIGSLRSGPVVGQQKPIGFLVD